jgi:7,8-dihydropterin-6-yl-methyl-4-(beta-D-ribofuranosyl)aminobenzene 5'-phosphate synthase
MCRLTILVDDEPGRGPTRAEHGLSIWIETGEIRILFDSGQGSAARDNARLLGVDVAKADAVAISHGHRDHTGGLPLILPDCPKARLFLHPDAMKPRYSRSTDGIARAIGYPHRAEELSAGRSGEIVWTRGATHISPSIFVTGEVPRLAPPEAPPARFFLDPECRVPDPFKDDQALIVDTDGGAIVILGCSHAGVWNTISYALDTSRSRRLRAVIGGMHLAEAPQGEIDQLADRIAKLGPTLVCPSHCSGQRAKEVLKRRFPQEYREGSTGAVLTVGA